MGLDQYITRKIFFYGKNMKSLEENEEIKKRFSEKELDNGLEITSTLQSFRKFTALHTWAVSNLQNGVDDMQDHIISEENLKKLLDIVKQVSLGDSATAQELFPNNDGYYFGNSGYDEFYWEDVKELETLLEDVLIPMSAHYDLYYGSNW